MTSRRHRRQYCAPDVSGCAHTECTHGLLPFVRVVLHLVPYHVPWYRTSLVRMVRSIIVHVRHDSALIMCRCMCLVFRLSTVRYLIVSLHSFQIHPASRHASVHSRTRIHSHAHIRARRNFEFAIFIPCAFCSVAARRHATATGGGSSRSAPRSLIPKTRSRRIHVVPAAHRAPVVPAANAASARAGTTSSSMNGATVTMEAARPTTLVARPI